MITVACPNPGCGRSLRLSEKYIGQKVGCTYCTEAFVVEAPPPAQRGATAGLDAPAARPKDGSRGSARRPAAASAAVGARSAQVPTPPPLPAADEPPGPVPEPPPLPPRPPASAGLQVGPLVVSLLSLAVIAGSLAGIVFLLRR